MQKLLNEKNIHKIINNLKKHKKKIVLCHGVFDLFHVGHLDYLKEAKDAGDILIVSVTTDRFVNKAPGRPFFNTTQRLNLLSSISLVDYVVESDFETAENIIQLIKPNIYFKGADYRDNTKDITNKIKKEINVLKKFKGKILYSRSQIFSSSKLLNKYEQKNENVDLFLSKFKKKYTFNFVNRVLNKASKISIFIIGETIFDKFVFCNYLGRSGKENILTVENINEKLFLGGSLALANHISALSSKVSVCSVIGDNLKDLSFIKKNLLSNVKFHFIKSKKSPTIVKEKIIEKSDNSKLLGIYKFNDGPILENEAIKIKKIILKNITKNKLILISDYGHGLISRKMAIDIIKKRKKNLFVNTQLNAANFGYHTIGKYINSSCAIINEIELRHELRNRHSKIEFLLPILAKRLNIKNLIVTAGAKGSYGYILSSKKFFYCPAFTNVFKDKIGAGDCYMGVFSIIFNIYPRDMHLAMFVASMATIDAISGYGSECLLDKTRLKKRIFYTLK